MEDIEANRNRPKLLLVDDDSLLRDSIARTLSADYSVTTAGNGQAALELMQQSDCRWIIVTDNRMPLMSGLEFLQRTLEMKEKVAGALVISGDAEIKSASNKTADRFLACGVPFLVLSKPFPKEDLFLFIAYIWKRSYETK